MHKCKPVTELNWIVIVGYLACDRGLIIKMKPDTHFFFFFTSRVAGYGTVQEENSFFFFPHTLYCQLVTMTQIVPSVFERGDRTAWLFHFMNLE